MGKADLQLNLISGLARLEVFCLCWGHTKLTEESQKGHETSQIRALLGCVALSALLLAWEGGGVFVGRCGAFPGSSRLQKISVCRQHLGPPVDTIRPRVDISQKSDSADPCCKSTKPQFSTPSNLSKAIGTLLTRPKPCPVIGKSAPSLIFAPLSQGTRSIPGLVQVSFRHSLPVTAIRMHHRIAFGHVLADTS